jgi:hypothetical protein
MKPLQFLAFCSCAFAGCLIGSWIALTPRTTASAQIRSGTNQVTVNETLVVPDGGLRIVDMRQRPLGYFGITQNGLSLVLLSRNGTPSVTMEGGPGGQVVVGANNTTAGVSAVSQGGATANLVASQQGARVEMIKQDRSIKLNLTDDAAITMSGRNNQNVFSVTTLTEGGQLRLMNRSGKEVFDVSSSLEQGKLKLSSAQDSTRLEADGKGNLAIMKGNEVIWSTAKSSLKPEGGTGDLPPTR